MAIDFFDRQDHARRQTIRLLVMFVLSVVVIILAIYLVVAVAAGDMESRPQHRAPPYGSVYAERPEGPPVATLWHPELFLAVTLGTIAVIALGSLYKIAELSSGGEAIALMMGGRAVNPQTTDLAERRLLNVVEEMALAAGVPVPPVYVLDHEPGINAFAAGHQPGDAVVAVSAGCLGYLTREELQGVLGHEFSHILNGDMRLNLRLIGIVYGILVLAVIGYYLLRSAGSFSSSRDDRRDNGAALALILGLAMLVLGYLGVFLGNLIKAAINRQREFLADASSVQFTRNPGGIAGALKKIGGLADGSRIRDGHAQEISHMFFGDAFAGSFFNLLATHPPLPVRIRALEPDFDGRFPQVAPVAAASEAAKAESSAARLETLLPAAALPRSAVAAMAMDAGKLVEHVGQPQTQHLEQASQMVAELPPPLLAAAREPSTAQALICALLLSRDDPAICARQLQLLQTQSPPLWQQTQLLLTLVRPLSEAAALPLVNLSIPALKKSSPQQYVRFRQVVETLVAADGKVDLFEYSLRTVLVSYLDVHFGLKKPPAVRYRTAASAAQPATVVLAMLAYVGQSAPEDVERAFRAGAAGLLGQVALPPSDACTLDAFDAALAELAQASPKLKRDLITAVTACIAADGKITVKEGELLRAVCAALACPVPPLPATAMIDTSPLPPGEG
jgi:Zn-dependent protease with chaperone function